MAVYDYAESFTSLLQQKYSKESCSDALTQSNGQVKFINAQTIKLPRMTVSGYKDHTRRPGFNSGTLSNAWEAKKLEHDRDVEFWIDPMDIDETNLTLSVANIQNTFETEQAIPEKDCYRFSKLHAELNRYSGRVNSDTVNAENFLERFDEEMAVMDEAGVPEEGRMLYVTPTMNKIIKEAEANQIIGKWNNQGLSAVGDIELKKVVNAWQSGVVKNRTYRVCIGQFDYFDPILEKTMTVAGLKTSVDGVEGLAIAEIQNSSVLLPAGNRPISIFSPKDQNSGKILELKIQADGFGGFYLWGNGGAWALIQLGINSSNGKRTVDMTQAERVEFRGDSGYGIYVYAQNQTSSGQTAQFVDEGSSYYRLYRGTSSSRRYKNSIRDMTETDIKNLYQIQPVMAKFNEDILGDNDERYGVLHPMFIAEDVNEYFPEAVDHNPDGSAENWNHKIMIPAMFEMVKSQKKIIESLEDRVMRLEKRNCRFND